MNIFKQKKEEVLQIDDLDPRKSRVLLNIETPAYVDRSVMGIRIDVLKKIMFRAGIGALSIKTVEGEDDQSEYMITGINEDGSATGIGARKRARHEHKIAMDEYLPKEMNFVLGAVHLNTKALMADIQDDKDSSIRDPEKWVEVLDKGIREELLKIAKKSLLRTTNLDINSTISFIVFLTILDLLVSGVDINILLTQQIDSWIRIMGVYFPIAKKIMNTPPKSIVEQVISETGINREDIGMSRLSLFNYFGYELGNMLVTLIRLKTQNILVQIPSETKETEKRA